MKTPSAKLSVYEIQQQNSIDAKRDSQLERSIIVDKKRLNSQYKIFCSLAKNRWWHAEVFRNASFRWGGNGRTVCR